MIDQWVERHVVLDGGMYEEQDAMACFYVSPHDHSIEIETISIDGCIYHASIIEKHIGKERMAEIIKRVEAWWDDDGYRNWRSNNEWNGARFYA
jgi:hypothetical protein